MLALDELNIGDTVEAMDYGHWYSAVVLEIREKPHYFGGRPIIYVRFMDGGPGTEGRIGRQSLDELRQVARERKVP